ncbi:MAG TPA: hypothetical protein VGI92_11135, partial [Gemmatimonadales bacterium]
MLFAFASPDRHPFGDGSNPWPKDVFPMEYSDRNSSSTALNGHSEPAVILDDQFTRLLLAAMVEFRDGNFGARLPQDLIGLQGKIADTFNDIVALTDRRARDVERVTRMVGKEGKLKERMNVF